MVEDCQSNGYTDFTDVTELHGWFVEEPLMPEEPATCDLLRKLWRDHG